jgi:uncharacterized membrane protein YkgB
MAQLPSRLIPLDLRLTRWMAGHAILALRLSLGIIFLWFGALKLVPGLSPAEGLATRTIELLSGGLMPVGLIAPGLGVWECLIGIGLISGVWMRATLLLLALQLPGTFTPLILFPSECFTHAPFAPTLEGQYIIKNLVLIAAGIAIGSTVRGGHVDPEPDVRTGAQPDTASAPRPS